ncbi:MAG: HAD family hydrolase, partial [Flavobacterium sp.]
SEDEIETCFQNMVTEYRDNCTIKTKPYDGIVELLNELVSRDIKLAVFSNKSDELTKKIVAEKFPHYFSDVTGLSVESLKKPNPFEAVLISQNWGLKPEEILFVGDSDIDMQTAINANMFAVGVTWGYRTEEELRSGGAKLILNTPMDLIQIL